MLRANLLKIIRFFDLVLSLDYLNDIVMYSQMNDSKLVSYLVNEHYLG